MGQSKYLVGLYCFVWVQEVKLNVRLKTSFLLEKIKKKKIKE